MPTNSNKASQSSGTGALSGSFPSIAQAEDLICECLDLVKFDVDKLRAKLHGAPRELTVAEATRVCRYGKMLTEVVRLQRPDAAKETNLDKLAEEAMKFPEIREAMRKLQGN